jgi:hypothetical protein
MTSEELFDKYLGSTDFTVNQIALAENFFLYQEVDGRYWVMNPPSEIRQYPRSPMQAVHHALEFIDNDTKPPDSFTGRPMNAVAQCFGLEHPRTADIPKDIPGPSTSPARQFRWLYQQHPGYVHRAPHHRTFGNAVPIGSLLYWDAGVTGGSGSVGIAVGYQNGLLQQITTNDSIKSLTIKGVEPNRCMGWTVPMFYANTEVHAVNLGGPDANSPRK